MIIIVMLTKVLPEELQPDRPPGRVRVREVAAQHLAELPVVLEHDTYIYIYIYVYTYNIQ